MVHLPLPTLVASPFASATRNGTVPVVMSGESAVVPSRRGLSWRAIEATTNAIPNPRFTDTTNLWTKSETTLVNDGVLDSEGFPSALMTSTGATDPYVAIAGTGVTVASNQYWTSSVYALTTQTGVSLLVGVYYRDVNGAFIYSGSTTVALTAGVEKRVSFSSPLSPVGSTGVTFIVAPVPKTIGTAIRLSRPQLEAKAYFSPYADGTLGTGHAWGGTVNASHSIRTAGQVHIAAASVGLPLSSSKGSVVFRTKTPSYYSNLTKRIWRHGNTGTGQAALGAGWNTTATTVSISLMAYEAGAVKQLISPTTLGFGRDIQVYYGWDGLYHEYTVVDADGVLIATGSNSARDVVSPIPTGMNFSLAGLGATQAGNSTFEGLVAYDRMLTNEEQDELFGMSSAWTWDTVYSQHEVPLPPKLTRPSVIAITPAYFLSDNKGNKLEDITPLVVGGKLVMNQDAFPIWTLTGQVRPHDFLRRYEDYMLVEATQSYSDGSDETFTLGLYHITVVAPRHNQEGSFSEFKGEDLTSRLHRARIDFNGSYRTDWTYTRHVRALIDGHGNFMRHQIPELPGMPTVNPYYEVGASPYQMSNDFLSAVGLRHLYQNRDGFLTSSLSTELDKQQVVAQYSADASGDMVDRFTGLKRKFPVIGPITEDPDDSRVRNQVTVRKVTPGQPLISYTAKNTNPSSPMRVTGPIGVLDPGPIDDNQLVTVADAQAIAEELVSLGSSYYRKTKMAIVPDLRFNPYDVVELDIRDVDGEVLIDGKWWRRSVELNLGPPVSALAAGMVMHLNRVEAIK